MRVFPFLTDTSLTSELTHIWRKLTEAQKTCAQDGILNTALEVRKGCEGTDHQKRGLMPK